MTKNEKMLQLNREWAGCERCGLHEEACNIVFGSGDADKSVFLFIGEAPREEEDIRVVPFIDAPGQELRQIYLKKFKLTSISFLTNIVCCRPPEDRVPLAKEIDFCMERINRMVAIINPLAIITVGRTPTAAITKKSTAITKQRGKMRPVWFDFQTARYQIPVFPIYHPFFIMKDGMDDEESYLVEMLDDFKTLNTIANTYVNAHKSQ